MRRMVQLRAASLKTKLLVLLLLLSVIPVIIVGLTSRTLMFRSGMDQNTVIAEHFVDLVASEINAQFMSLDQMLNALIIDEAFQRYVHTSNEDTVSQLRQMQDFGDYLEKLAQSRTYIRGILYVDQGGKTFYESGAHNESINYLYDLRDDEFYGQLFERDSLSLLPTHERSYMHVGRREVFSLVKPVTSFSGKVEKARLIVEIDPQVFFAFMEKTERDSYHQILLYHEATGDHISISEGEAPAALLAQHEPQAAHKGTYIYQKNRSEGQTQVSYEQLAYDNWTLISLAELEEMSKGIKRATGVIWSVGALLVMGSIVLATLSANSILRPLYRLKQSMTMLSKTKKLIEVPRASHSEIDFLIHTYNKMLTRIDVMEMQVFKTTMRQKEVELLQLQAYINPHFLFNTLEIIELYAIRNEGEKIEEVVQIVAKMMRFSIRQDGGWTTVREELDYVRDLLRIHQFRTQNDIGVRWLIDPASEFIPIMKLSIQPFVENALKYGWSPVATAEPLELTVESTVSDSGLRLVISDNGTGMDEITLGYYRQLIASRGEIVHDYFKRHTGIYNVYRRFLLAYGSRLEMSIDHASSGGVRITIEIANKGDAEDDPDMRHR
ncbi:cache domain-containing sensor histidine kinase [Paenibacillus chungangensis]|uniref:Sensor histidine kinase n=1 Tax=Paenibacillus chungangensis TaxID=696535 RepID=A0ABW3HRE7_9BACL